MNCQPKTTNWRKTRPGFFLPMAIFFVLLVILAIAPLWFYIIQYKINKPEPSPTSQIQTSTPSATKDDIANWKTYTDDKYSFSFKYPESWYFKRIFWDYPDKEDSVRFFQSGETEKISTMMFHGNEQLIISVKNNLNWKELQSNFNSESEIEILGHKALKYASGVYILLDGDKNIIISINRYVAPYNQKLLDQILSTFKFTQ